MSYFTLPRKHTTTVIVNSNNNDKEDKPLLSEASCTQYHSTSVTSSDCNSRSSPQSQNTTTTSSCITPIDGMEVKPINRLTHLRKSNWSLPSSIDSPILKDNDEEDNTNSRSQRINSNYSSNSGRTSSSSNSNINNMNGYDDIFTPIQIPLLQLSNNNNNHHHHHYNNYHNNNNNNNSTTTTAKEKKQIDAITHEINTYITFGIIASLLCPLLSTIIVFQAHHTDQPIWMQQSLQPLLLVTWCLIFVIWHHRPKRMKLFLSCTQYINILTFLSISMIPTMFIIIPEYIYLLMSLLFLSFCLFYLCRRLNYANQQLHLSLQQRVTNHYNLVQRHLNDQSFLNTQRRLSFLSTISNEIQDAALMIISTLEQFSPSELLMMNGSNSNTSNELLSACSIAVPISSITAIHTTMKQVCHISSHLQLMSCFVQQNNNHHQNNMQMHQQQQYVSNVSISSDHLPMIRSPIQQTFDIGELLQNIGDSLAGMASKLDVNFVIYHWDNILHHIKVLGDESALRHALLNLIRNVLESCTPGACIELGLNSTTGKNSSSKTNVTFEVIYIPSPAIPVHLLSEPILSETHLTKQLIQYAGGSLSIYALPKNRTRFEINIELETPNINNNNSNNHPINNSNNNGHHPFFIKETNSSVPTQLQKAFNHIKFANEPTLKELMKFMETLKGLKMVLHAKEQSMFAKHLTGCLASWNTDISHVPVSQLDCEDTLSSSTSDILTPGSDSYISTDSSISSASKSNINTNTNNNNNQQQKQVPSPAIAEEQLHSIPPAFILIDDHIITLEQKLIEFRTHTPVSISTLQHHRRHKHSKSTSSIHHHNHSSHGTTTAIIHFTSLSNYTRVRDTIQWVATLPMPFLMPKIVVVPKPAGPRRYLTALHTAWHNAMVKPHFIPIATSPSSPLPTLTPSFLSSSSDLSSTTTTNNNNNNNNNTSRTPPTPNGYCVNGPFTVSHFDYRSPNDINNNQNGYRSSLSSRKNNIHHFPLQQHEPSSYFFDRTSLSTINNNNNNININNNISNNNNNNNCINISGNNRIRRRSYNNDNTTFDYMTTGHQPNNINNVEFLKAINNNFQQMISPLTKIERTCKGSSPSKEYNNNNITVPSNTNDIPISPIDPTPVNNNNNNNCGNNKPESLTCNTSPAILPPNDEGGLVTTSPQEMTSSTSLNSNDCNTNNNNNNNNNNHGDHSSIIHSPNIVPPTPTNCKNNINSNSNKTPMSEHKPSLPSPPLSQSQQQSSPSSSTSQTESKAKVLSKMANIKMNNKKKKKDKGTPFSNTVSPPINVLIVEDNIINQAILSAWMKKHKIQFSVASDGKEAVEKWKKGGFHLILMDIQLPVMDGIEATKTIRSIEKEKKIGVLPMSSFFLRQQQQLQQQLQNELATTNGETNNNNNNNNCEVESLSSPTSTHSNNKSILEEMLMDPSQSAPSTFRSPVIIVALTASSLESDRHAALAAGCNDFLTKPVSLEWLEKKITEWGCMQALIDFEGWRQWKQSSANDGDNHHLSSSSSSSPGLINKVQQGGSHNNNLIGINTDHPTLGNNNNKNNHPPSQLPNNKLLSVSSASALSTSSIINKSSISLARRLSYFNAHYMAKMKSAGEDNNNNGSDYNSSPLSNPIEFSSSSSSSSSSTTTTTTRNTMDDSISPMTTTNVITAITTRSKSYSVHEKMPSKYYEEMNEFIKENSNNNNNSNNMMMMNGGNRSSIHPIPTSPTSPTSPSVLTVVKNPFNGQKGLLLPGAVGLSKRRYSTMEKPSIRKNSSIQQVPRTISLNRLPIQKSLSESTNTPGMKKKPTTKKAVSMDDSSMRPSSSCE